MLNKLLDYFDLEKVELEPFPENYFPIPDNYIVFQTGSERPSQVYNHYFEVIGHLNKILQNEGIKVVQIGDVGDPFVPYAIDLRGKLSVRNVAHVIKNAEVCITSSSLASKLARTYDIPLVLIGANFPRKIELESFNNIVYIEPELNGTKWNYKIDDPDRTVSTIKPELISKAILDKLNIQYPELPETIFVGKKYGEEIIDFVPDAQLPQNFIGKTLNIRLDIYFESNAVANISQFCKANVVTKQSINLDNINISNIIQIVYICSNSVNTEFVKKCIKKGINILIVCDQEEKINDIRFKLLGVASVYKKKIENPLDKLDLCATMFRSSRIICGRNKIYSSIYHYKRDIQTNMMQTELPESIDDDFLEFLDHIIIFKLQL